MKGRCDLILKGHWFFLYLEIGLLGIEPSSHRYKQWALTNMR